MPRDRSTRNELTDRKDQQTEDMRELRDKLEKKAEDLATVRRLLEELDLDGGTSDGAAEIEESVDRAERVTEEVFDQDDKALDQIHADAEGYQSELTERKETSESNLGRISDVTAPLETQETIDQIREGKEAALRDVDFLQDLLQRAMDALEESENVQNDLRDMRGSGG